MRSWGILLAAVLFPHAFAAAQTSEDPYRWLNDVQGERALAWVRAHTVRTLAALEAVSAFDSIYAEALEIYRTQERINAPTVRGNYGYDHWRDQQHERGLWRRATVSSFVGGDPVWEPLLDVDSLAEAEGEDWTLDGEKCLPPEYSRCLLRLSRGGRDAVVVREFDLESKTFVEGGFSLPEARSSYEWMDQNTLLVATDFGEGTTTDFGWPRMVKEWKRGTPLSEADVLFGSESPDAEVSPVVERSPERTYVLVVQEWLVRKEYEVFALEDSCLVRIDIPVDAWSRLHAATGQWILLLRSDWAVGDVTYPQGTLLSIDHDGLLHGDRTAEVVFHPDGVSHAIGFALKGGSLALYLIRQDQSETLRFRREGGRWVQEELTSEEQSFLTAPPVRLVREDGTVAETTARKPSFDVTAFTEHRYEAVSRDGTRVPYFIVYPRGMELNDLNATVLYGYGGYGTSMIPEYDPVLGKAWLERGGVYVLAQTRGGGEFGPEWHRAALRQNRQRAFDDFVAVAKDLISRGFTSPAHLGIMGQSNGGLLVGAVLMQHPDLFGAVACLDPVLDLSKADEFPDAGAEFGDPKDPNDWAYMEKLSPYHNLSAEATYPRVLFMTSTTDDRVGPGHARRMAAKMEDMGHPVYFYESEEGGHVGRGPLEQKALRTALIFAYFLDQLH